MRLRFGIRPFEFDDVKAFLSENTFEGISMSFTDVLEKVTQVANLRHFEITGDLIYVLPGLITESTIQDLITLKNEHALTYSVHLPLWSIELSSPNEHIRSASINCLLETINLTKPLNPDCWVIHATGALATEFFHMKMPSYLKDVVITQFTLNACRSIEEIIDRTGINPRKLAIENVEFPFKEFFEGVEELDVSICFDTGHLLAGYSGDWDIIDFLETYQDRIIELHLHDGKKPGVDHQVLGKHALPVRDLLSWLKDRNFQGPIVFELSLANTIKSLRYIQSVYPEAFQ